jgi:transposase
VAELAQAGVRVISVDEKTGIQALERDGNTLPMQPGVGERREYNYIRHGTKVLIGNLDLATGELVHPTVGDTRTEADFLTHIAGTVATDHGAEWIFLSDQLNTHKSASLVTYVAGAIGDTNDLGVKGVRGILKNMTSRMTYLSDPSHRIRFVYTPKHCSWLNPIEVWFSTLSSRVLRRGNFTSGTHLKEKIVSYIDYYNTVLAKPFRWSVVKTRDIQAMLDRIAATQGLLTG